MNENENKYLSLKTAAGLYGYTRDHLGLMIRQGKLKGIKLGSYYVTTNEWVADYIKEYSNPNHPANHGKFSNKFLIQAFAEKKNAASYDNAKKTKNKTSKINIQNKSESDFFGDIQKELLPSLRELSVMREETSVLSTSSIPERAVSGNPYIILPIRKMKKSERESILEKISDYNRLKNESEAT